MIQFFRRIRQNLIDQQRVGKYLLYAIGEILLVVIGILIALQINNWNQQRKDRKLEYDLLVGLRNDLSDDLKQIESSVNRSHQDLKLTIKRFDSVINLQELNLDYLDSLFYYRCIRPRNTFFPQTGTYQSIINNGNSSIISNNDLFKKIQIVYDRIYQRLLLSGNRLDVFNDKFRHEMVKSRSLNNKDRILFYKNPATINELNHWLERNIHYNNNVNGGWSMNDDKKVISVLDSIKEELKKF